MRSNPRLSRTEIASREHCDTYIKLLFLRSRYYSPETARFLSKDVWQGDYTRPQTLNGWGYVEGEPIGHTDPSGRWALDLSGGHVWAIRESNDNWRTLLKALGIDLSTVPGGDWGQAPSRLKLDSYLDPLILKTAQYQMLVSELYQVVRLPFPPPPIMPQQDINCYPTALTCSAGKCSVSFLEDYGKIDAILRKVTEPIQTESDLQLGDIFRLGGHPGRSDPTVDEWAPKVGLDPNNMPLHYGMILLRSAQTGTIWTFNGALWSAYSPKSHYAIVTQKEIERAIGVQARGMPGDPSPYYRLQKSVDLNKVIELLKEAGGSIHETP